MSLVDREIRVLCEQGFVRSGEDAPRFLVTPYNPKLVESSSLDVRLGSTIRRKSTAHSHAAIRSSWAQLDPIYRAIPWDVEDISRATPDRPAWLRPGEFILGHTLEYFCFPADIKAEFSLKSSRAREGFNHAKATWCDPEWEGTLTLELQSMLHIHSDEYLPIYPGLLIGQMVFMRGEIPDKSYRFTGHYNGDLTAQPSKMYI